MAGFNTNTWPENGKLITVTITIFSPSIAAEWRSNFHQAIYQRIK
jgi:hypothetical protein